MAVSAAAPSRLEGNPWTPYLFAAPIAIYLLIFQLYPLANEFWLGFTGTQLLTPRDNPWVGLDNYRYLLSDSDFQQVIATTALYTVACVALAIGMGLASALLLDGSFRGRGIARSLITLPWATPSVAAALVFTWIFNSQYGIFDYVLRLLHLPFSDANWLDSPALAMPAILIATIWQIFPFSSVVILAALQGVPAELKEAAKVDGAGQVGIFKVAIWPTIQPTILMLVLFVTIWSLRRFDLIWLMTQGGPLGATETLVIGLYRSAFVEHDLGTAAAIGMVGVAVALVATFGYFRIVRAGERARQR